MSMGRQGTSVSGVRYISLCLLLLLLLGARLLLDKMPSRGQNGKEEEDCHVGGWAVTGQSHAKSA